MAAIDLSNAVWIWRFHRVTQPFSWTQLAVSIGSIWPSHRVTQPYFYQFGRKIDRFNLVIFEFGATVGLRNHLVRFLLKYQSKSAVSIGIWPSNRVTQRIGRFNGVTQSLTKIFIANLIKKIGRFCASLALRSGYATIWQDTGINLE